MCDKTVHEVTGVTSCGVHGPTQLSQISGRFIIN